MRDGQVEKSWAEPVEVHEGFVGVDDITKVGDSLGIT